jgi:hypothetical protein
MQRSRSVWALVAVASLAAGCGSPERLPEKIDGYPVGSPIPCPSVVSCEMVLVQSRGWLDRWFPNHAPIVQERLFSRARGAVFEVTTIQRAVALVVMNLADGSVRSVAITCVTGVPGPTVCTASGPQAELTAPSSS